jgi:hypothetical protein
VASRVVRGEAALFHEAAPPAPHDHFTSGPAVTRVETSIIFDARWRHALPVFPSGD